ncbi:MAG TPA: 2-oxo-4-hydroxy-4-carboxy-5-ureidoimidazoline decarboxylase [Candidatus Dormibacteraeota bacterium]|nr:2-oxo-4-hydroxy-4-carboxy-5-ureidoimidazoline decarboxylase [Candidatus Dormibacteraeota bacterium]
MKRPPAPGLDRLNQLPPAQAERELLACCGSRRWAAELTAARPLPTRGDLLDAAERTWWALHRTDWDEAFAAHPRIGERAAADGTARREQQGVATAAPSTLAELAEGNRRYEERFDRVFLICATGRSAEEMLRELRRRLRNDDDDELREAAREQARITRLRLERLLDGAKEGGTRPPSHP